MPALGPAVLTPTRTNAYTALMAAVASHRAQVPCPNRTDLDWLMDDDREARAAAADCVDCPAIEEWSAYAKVHRQDAGVWADRAPGQRGRAVQGRKPHDDELMMNRTEDNSVQSPTRRIIHAAPVHGIDVRPGHNQERPQAEQDHQTEAWAPPTRIRIQRTNPGQALQGREIQTFGRTAQQITPIPAQP